MRKTYSIRVWGNILGIKIICVIAVIAIATITFTVGNIRSFAGLAVPERDVYKYYTSICIEKGDTLWSIANQYMTEEYDGIEEYIYEVRRLNLLCGDGIHAGKYLMIPRYAVETY